MGHYIILLINSWRTYEKEIKSINLHICYNE